MDLWPVLNTYITKPFGLVTQMSACLFCFSFVCLSVCFRLEFVCLLIYLFIWYLCRASMKCCFYFLALVLSLNSVVS